MSKILTEISSGELLDKLSILEIKLNKIKKPIFLQEVKKEYDLLNKTKNNNINSSDKIDILYKNLKEINEKLWKIENEIRLCEKNSDFNDKFVQLARNVYFENDKRAKIKLEINKVLGSNIKEVKQYTEY
ncbi:MAG: hypothetical protein CMI70_00760 [Candidatus Pelagibacter sp.]|jgi:hypothetical protein|nr:hypothetical protein [Candidatus Pelagibacter sp.]|tara:strand:- start:1078 stop:1467 length:390 start_codon:yes stop_codon:yes gene_type:complete